MGAMALLALLALFETLLVVFEFDPRSSGDVEWAVKSDQSRGKDHAVADYQGQEHVLLPASASVSVVGLQPNGDWRAEGDLGHPKHYYINTEYI